MNIRCSNMKNIFNDSQNKVQSHPRLVKDLLKLYRETSSKEFVKDFLNYLTLSLSVPVPNVHVNNTHLFVIKFAVAVQEDQKENNVNASNGSSDLNSEALDDQEEDIVNEFTCQLFDYLIELHHAANLSVRLKAAQLIVMLLNGIGANATLDDDRFEHITKGMLIYLKDKVANVRIQAILALAKLQDPTNKNCPVTKEFLFHLARDPNPFVREVITKNIAATVLTLFPVIERTRDVKVSVRIAAYNFLAERVHVKSLTISQRIRLLREGLKDRSDHVREAVEINLIPSWLKMFSNSIPAFLKCLDVQGCVEAADLTLKALFKNTDAKKLQESFNLLNESKLLDEEKLNCENVFYWHNLICHFKELDNNDGEECIDMIRPDVKTFCSYAKNYISNYDHDWDIEKKLEHEFVSSNLLSISSNFELSDLAARQFLEKMAIDIISLEDLRIGVIKPLVSCLIKLYTNPQSCLDFFAETISNIRQPITTQEVERSETEIHQVEMDIAKIVLKLNVLRDKLENVIKNEDFTAAQNTKETISELEAKKLQFEQLFLPMTQEVRVEKSDFQTIFKCLTIVSELLLQITVKTVSPTLRSILENLILPGIQNEEPSVRHIAALCLGLCCMIDKNVAVQHIVLLIQISQIDQETIQTTALKSIYDLLLLYGLETFTADDVMEKTIIGDVIPETPPHGGGVRDPHRASNLVTLLKAQLSSEYENIRVLTVQGLGKLMVLGRLYSPQILSNFILIWFNPSTEDELVQFLAVFIPLFAASGKNGQQALEECFITCLTTIMDAPKSNQLSQVEPLQMGKLILRLLSPHAEYNKSKIEETNAHDRLAEKILNKICQDKDSPSNRDWSKLLLNLFLSTKCLPIHKQMFDMTTTLTKRISDKATVKCLHKFKDILSNITAYEKSNSGSSYNIETVTSVSPTSSDVSLLKETPKPGLKRRHFPDLTKTFISETDDFDLSNLDETIKPQQTDSENTEDSVFSLSSLPPSIIVSTETSSVTSSANQETQSSLRSQTPSTSSRRTRSTASVKESSDSDLSSMPRRSTRQSAKVASKSSNLKGTESAKKRK